MFTWRPKSLGFEKPETVEARRRATARERKTPPPFHVCGACHSAAHCAALSIFVLLCEGGDVAHTLRVVVRGCSPASRPPAERGSRSV